MSSTQTLSGLTINLVDSETTFAALRTQGDVVANELWLVEGSDTYTKAEIDTMIGNVETLLAGI